MAAIWYLYCSLIFSMLYFFTKRFSKKIENLPPRPFPCLPVIGHLHLLKQPIFKTLSEIAKKHGDLLLLQYGSRPVLLVSSPAAAEECFTTNDVACANRPRFLMTKHFAINNTSLAWAPYGDHWRNLRRLVSLELLSSGRLQLLQWIRVNEVKSMVSSLIKRQNRPLDMRVVFFELTLNVMMMMIAGKRYVGDNITDAKEAKKFREIHGETFKIGGTMAIVDYIPWIKSWKLEKQMIELQKERDAFMQNLIEERRRKMKSNRRDGESWKTLIDVILILQETDPEYYSDAMIRSLILVLILAGTDTTINTMEWSLSLLLNHPEVLKKVQMEIDNQIGENKRLLEESDLPKLPFLRSIILESNRMYPPLPLLVPHETSKDCIIGGFRVPSGTMISTNAWAIQNDPNTWEDPRSFKPERHKSSVGFPELGGRDGFKLMPFGSGRRGCPGEALAVRTVGLALGTLIQCFDWSRVGEEMVDMTEAIAFSLQKGEPLQAKCKPRAIMAKFLSQEKLFSITDIY